MFPFLRRLSRRWRLLAATGLMALAPFVPVPPEPPATHATQGEHGSHGGSDHEHVPEVDLAPERVLWPGVDGDPGRPRRAVGTFTGFTIGAEPAAN
jgi:hypothetical protein